MWNWIKKQAAPIAAIATILIVLTGLLQFAVVNPIHQRFDAINQHFDVQDKRIDDFKAEMNQRFNAQDKYINQRFDTVGQRFDTVDQRFEAQDKYISQRFDAQDKRIEDLAKDVSDLRKLSERVSRNEGEIDVIRQQLQTADAPSP